VFIAAHFHGENRAVKRNQVLCEAHFDTATFLNEKLRARRLLPLFHESGGGRGEEVPSLL
jgi:hypothetical protein